MSVSPQPFEGFENYADYSGAEYEYQQYGKQQAQENGFDFFYAASDVAAPPIDLFEKELDSSLAFAPELQINLLDLDYDFLPAVMGHRGPMGPPSSITSGDSASGYRDDESAYSYSQSGYSYHPPIDLGLELEMQGVQLEKKRIGSEYALPTVDPTSFTNLPINSPTQSFSDYTPSVVSASSNYYPALDYTARVPSINSTSASTEDKYKSSPSSASEDPRRRFKCNHCPRSFARAYNLKTHMATHDPNRAKPHVCSHAGCGRSFSRKHDLGRHLFSIHKEGQGNSYGVESGSRSWCDSCGKGLIGNASCSCDGAD